MKTIKLWLLSSLLFVSTTSLAATSASSVANVAEQAVYPDFTPIAIGLPSEDSCGSGIGGETPNPSSNLPASCFNPGPENNSLPNSGALIVDWKYGERKNRVFIKAPNPDEEDNFGKTSSFSSDYKTLAVGAPKEDGCYAGVDGSEGLQYSNTVTCFDRSNLMLTNGFDDSGAVYVYSGNGRFSSQDSVIQGSSILLSNTPTYIKSPNIDMYDGFGSGVRLSSDGLTLAISAPFEDNCGTGVDGKGKNNNRRLGGNHVCGYGNVTEGLSNNEALNSGAMYIYTKASGKWELDAYIKSPNTDAGDLFGSSFTLSANGKTLIVGAPGEDGCGTGIGGLDPNPNQRLGANPVCGSSPQLGLWDNNSLDSGAAYLYRKRNGKWHFESYIKAINTDAGDKFGSSITFAYYEDFIFIGAPGEDGCGADVGGETSNINTRLGGQNVCGTNANLGPNNNALEDSGAVYAFYGLTPWAYIKSPAPDSGDMFGSAVVATKDKNGELIISAPGEDSCLSYSEENVSCSLSSFISQGGDVMINMLKDNNMMNSGTVYSINIEGDTRWNILKPKSVNAGDAFGTAMAIASSPSTGNSVLFVGAPGFDYEGKDDIGQFSMYVFNSDKELFELEEEFFTKMSNNRSVNNARSITYYEPFDTLSSFDYAGAVAPTGGDSAVKEEDSSCDLLDMFATSKGVAGIADFFTCLGRFGIN